MTIQIYSLNSRLQYQSKYFDFPICLHSSGLNRKLLATGHCAQAFWFVRLIYAYVYPYLLIKTHTYSLIYECAIFTQIYTIISSNILQIYLSGITLGVVVLLILNSNSSWIKYLRFGDWVKYFGFAIWYTNCVHKTYLFFAKGDLTIMIYLVQF